MSVSLDPSEFDAMPTLADMIRHHGATRGGDIAQSFEGRNTTYAALDQHASQVAAALIAAGVRPGEAIAYFGKNSDQYFELVLGAAKAGAIIAPIGWRLAPAEAAYIIDDARARLLFAGAELMDAANDAIARSHTRPILIGMETGFEAWRDAHAPNDPALPVDQNDPAILLYTSGTTGRPKGVMLTGANLMRSRRALAAARMGWNEWKKGETNLVAMPAAHIGGTGWGLVGLINGVRNVITREFNPVEVIELIEKERIAKVFMVPAALQFIVRLPRAREIDYASLTHILYGASPIPLDLLRECMEVFGCEFCQQYGMTETTGTIVYLPPEDHDPAGNQRMRSAGLPMPGVEIRIQDADGAVLGPNEIGEVATRSEANMAGYWRNKDATAAAVDADGWLRTGDAGYLDEDGYLFIQDRIKDMICSGAENIYPAEVESAIFGHPSIAEVAVIGVPDDVWGEAVKAIVVPKPGAEQDADAIIAFAKSRIAHYKAPKSVDFRAAPLPRNPSGKILRRELREPYWAGRERKVN